MFLSAIGDLLILNTRNTCEREVKEFFEKMAYAANRLNGKDLFKGKLEFCLRDIEN